LAPPDHNLAHPAFSNLFVKRNAVAQPAGNPLHAPAAVGRRAAAVAGAFADCPRTTVGEASFETDACASSAGQNPGRTGGHGPRRQLSTAKGRCSTPWSASATFIRLQPNETVLVDLVTGVAESAGGRHPRLMTSTTTQRLADRVFRTGLDAQPHSAPAAHASEADAQAYGQLAGSVIYASALRGESQRAHPHRRGQSGAVGYGISGDLPIVLSASADRTRLELVLKPSRPMLTGACAGSAWICHRNEDDSVLPPKPSRKPSWTSSPPVRKRRRWTSREAFSSAAASRLSEEDRTLLQTVARWSWWTTRARWPEQAERGAAPTC